MATTTASRVFWLFVTVGPWIMVYVFSALCDERKHEFDTAEEKRDDDITGCVDYGFVALASVTYILVVIIGTYVRQRIRANRKIDGSIFWDFLVFLIFPACSIYQTYLEVDEDSQDKLANLNEEI